MATFFDVVPLEVRKEILLLESKEVEGLPYHSDFEVMGEDLKWIQDPTKPWKKQLFYHNSLALHQQLDTLFR